MQLLPKGIELIGLSSLGFSGDLEETSPTLEGNALQKARYVFEHFQIPCFADDTGLEVAALDGAPGVYSARYAGEEKSPQKNMELLLNNLAGKPREAQFRTVIALVGLTTEPVCFEGVVRGYITSAPRGSGGFGYDPVFVPEGHDKTFAEMELSVKNNLSHRALAIQKLTEFLKSC